MAEQEKGHPKDDPRPVPGEPEGPEETNYQPEPVPPDLAIPADADGRPPDEPQVTTQKRKHTEDTGPPGQKFRKTTAHSP